MPVSRKNKKNKNMKKSSKNSKSYKKNFRKNKKTRNNMRKIRGGGNFIMPEIIIPEEGFNIDYYNYLTNLSNLVGFNLENNNKETRKAPNWGIDITHLLLKKYSSDCNLYGLYYHDSKNPDKNNIDKIIYILRSKLIKRIELFRKNAMEFKILELEGYLIQITSDEFWEKSKYFIICNLNGKIHKSKLEINFLNTSLCKKGFGNILMCIYLNLFKSLTNINVSLESANDALISLYEKYGFTFAAGRNGMANINHLLVKCESNTKEDYGNIKLILVLESKYINNMEPILDSIDKDRIKTSGVEHPPSASGGPSSERLLPQLPSAVHSSHSEDIENIKKRLYTFITTKNLGFCDYKIILLYILAYELYKNIPEIDNNLIVAYIRQESTGSRSPENTILFNFVISILNNIFKENIKYKSFLTSCRGMQLIEYFKAKTLDDNGETTETTNGDYYIKLFNFDTNEKYIEVFINISTIFGENGTYNPENQYIKLINENYNLMSNPFIPEYQRTYRT